MVSGNEWKKAHPEKVREYNRRYLEKNRDKVNEYNRKWSKEHPRQYSYFYPNCKLRDCDFIEEQLEAFRKMKTKNE